jgi:hypothetical protein
MIHWTKEMIQQALEDIDVSGSYDYAATQLSKRVGEHVSAEQLRSALRRRNGGVSPISNRATLEEAMDIPARDPVQFTPPFHVQSRGALVLADLHVPFHHAEFLSVALRVGGAMAIEDVYIVGDLFNFDSLSAHPANEPRVAPDRDLDVAGDVLEAIARQPFVRRIFITNGNHDERLARRLGSNIQLRHLVAAATGGRIIEADLYTTEYDFMFHNSTWVVGHLSSYSRRPGERARKIAERYGRNVAVGHDHIQGFTSTLDGQYLAVSVGAMFGETSFSSTPFWYKERRLNDFPPTQRGFLVLDTDIPYLFNEHGLSPMNGGLPWEDVDNWLRRFQQA